MRAALPRERPHPAPLVLLPFLTTSLIIHVQVSVALFSHQILSLMCVIAFLLGLKKRTRRNKCFHFDIPRITRAEGQLLSVRLYVIPPVPAPPVIHPSTLHIISPLLISDIMLGQHWFCISLYSEYSEPMNTYYTVGL